MFELSKMWAEFGLNGLIIGTLFLCVYFLVKTQKEERQEWLEAYREQCNRYDARQQETNAVLQSLSNVIHGANNRYRGDAK